MARRLIAVVPHTHWDREWYASFQTFRLRLVDLLDDFLPFLERDERYTHFLLDGQMAVVDDYLEVRPEAAPTLRRLADSGRLAVGPWYALMDEFLVSGECIIRNLELGLSKSREFGGPSPVGYLPDMFGHIAQMPQILRAYGMEHTVLWRGVPAAVTGTGFWWLAPDGSGVRAQYLCVGYGNGAATPRTAAGLLRRIDDHLAELGDRLRPDEPLLWMNGTDHQVPQPWLGDVLAEANSAQDRYEFRVLSLAELVSKAHTDGLPTIVGELRSSARANLLMGVVSNRVDVRQAAARAELALERRAEPLAALFLRADKWPARLLDMAWLETIRNSAHDSICACSHDGVVAAVLHRYTEATDIANGVAERALTALARSMATAGSYVMNPSARVRDGLVELTIPGEADPGATLAGTQTLEARPTTLVDLTIRADELGAILGQIRSQAFGDSYINAVTVTDHDDGRGFDVTAHADAFLYENPLVEEIKRELYAKAKRAADAPVHVRITQPPSVRVLAHAPAVPGFGWRRWEPQLPEAAPVRVLEADDGSPVLENGLVRVDLAATDGFGFVLTDLRTGEVARADRLVDGGDQGDTYNYSPPAFDSVVDSSDEVEVDVLEYGPLRARARVVRTYHWPERVDDDAGARVGSVRHRVETIIDLHLGEPWVRLSTTIDNRAKDHRLRSHFGLPNRTATSLAECAFCEVERGLETEGGLHERGLATYPARRWVRAGGLTIAFEAVTEYELTNISDGEASQLALTLLRCTGMLSRVEMAYRPLPAGPPDLLDGPQLQRPVTIKYAAGIGFLDPYAMVDAVFLPMSARHCDGGGHRPAAGSGLQIEGAEVSAVRRTPGTDDLEVRLWNPSSGYRVAHVDTVNVPLGPWRIETVRVPAA